MVKANTNNVLITVIVVYSIIILPFFLNINLYYTSNCNKLFFQINLFGFVKIISGYLTVLYDGLAFHITKNKAIIFFYKDMLSIKSKVKPLKDYHIFNANLGFEIGYTNYPTVAYVSSFLISFITNLVAFNVNAIKPYVSVTSDTLLMPNNKVSAYGKFTVVLNLLMIILSLIKILVGKFLQCIKKIK